MKTKRSFLIVVLAVLAIFSLSFTNCGMGTDGKEIIISKIDNDREGEIRLLLYDNSNKYIAAGSGFVKKNSVTIPLMYYSFEGYHRASTTPWDEKGQYFIFFEFLSDRDDHYYTNGTDSPVPFNFKSKTSKIEYKKFKK
jgi:hypothetical protein